MEAERDTVDRYVAAYLADRVGAEFTGRINGVSRAGAFIRLDETGADGLVPISTLGSDYFRHDRDRQTLTGERTGRVIGLGMRVTVRLREAAPITGGLILELIELEGAKLAPARRAGGTARPARSASGRRRRRGREAAAIGAAGACHATHRRAIAARRRAQFPSYCPRMHVRPSPCPIRRPGSACGRRPSAPARGRGRASARRRRG